MKRYLFRLMFLLFFCPFISLVSMAGNASAHSHLPSLVTYNCGGYSANHCYGVADENTGGRFWGATTSVDARILGISSSDPNAFIENEIWLNDDIDPSLCNPVGGTCWIEVGYAVDAGGTADGMQLNTLGTHMFWADVRANNAYCYPFCYYQEHERGLFSLSSSDVGKKITLTISNLGGLRNNWKVSASIAGGKSFTAVSTNNFMPGGENIRFGQELAGSGTAGVTTIAQTAHFDSNKYQASASAAWTAFTSLGSVSSPGPPWAGWTYPPSSSHPGGSLYTCTKASTGFNPC